MKTLRYLLCTALRAPICVAGLTAILTRWRWLYRQYLAADIWLCAVGRIGDNGKQL